jgi:hypothetical protein
MANTSNGRQAAGSKQLVGEVAGSGGAAGWRHCLTMGGVVLFGCLPLTDGVCDDVLDVVEGIAGETVIELTQRKRDYRKVWFRQENVYLRKN